MVWIILVLRVGYEPVTYGCEGLPVLQNTKLGYILSGKIHNSYVKQYKKQCHSFFVQTDSLHNMMERFWSIEEMTNKILTKDHNIIHTILYLENYI
jgi:hypothetical protein